MSSYANTATQVNIDSSVNGVGVDKPIEAERAPSNDNAAKPDAADQSSATSDPADLKPASDNAVDYAAVVKANKCDPTAEQLNRYKRRFQIW